MLFLILLIGPTIAQSWEAGASEHSEAAKCFVYNLASYQGDSPYSRQRPMMNLAITSLQPLKSEFSVSLGYDNALKTVGAIKIGDALFKLRFNGGKGLLAASDDEADLLNALRTSEKAVIGFKVADTYVFDSYDLMDLDKKLLELQSTCRMQG